MKGKDNNKRAEPALESNSMELFEEIFNQATMEIRIEKEGKAQKQKYSPVLASSRGLRQKLKAAEKKVIRPSKPAAQGPEKAKGSPVLTRTAVTDQPAPRPARAGDKPTALTKRVPKKDSGKLKKLIAPRTALLVILLAMLVGILSAYLGIIDIPLFQHYLKFGNEQVATKVGSPGKQSVVPSEKATSSLKQPQEKEQSPSKSTSEPKAFFPAPPQSSSSSGVKEDKLTELEKPSTVPQATSGTERVEGKQPSAAAEDRLNFSEIAARQGSQPSSVQTELSPKSNPPEPATPKPSALKYPYSAYLGSFKSADAVKKAMSDYYEGGLSPYWAKVDLGDKGVWFRFFAGYFQTKEEAEKFIRDRNIQGASLGITKYANLIGIYSSDIEVEDIRRMIESVGFYPYVIKGPSGKSYLYSGAFDRKEYAEKEQIILASKGITSKTTER